MAPRTRLAARRPLFAATALVALLAAAERYASAATTPDLRACADPALQSGLESS